MLFLIGTSPYFKGRSARTNKERGGGVVIATSFPLLLPHTYDLLSVFGSTNFFCTLFSQNFPHSKKESCVAFLEQEIGIKGVFCCGKYDRMKKCVTVFFASFILHCHKVQQKLGNKFSVGLCLVNGLSKTISFLCTQRNFYNLITPIA